MKKSLIVSIICFILMCNLCFAKTIIVDKYGNGDFFAIQDALDSSDHLVNTIKVLPGIYEENIKIDRRISLIGSGPNMTYIRAISQIESAIKTNGTDPIFIQGFKISGTKGIQIESHSTTTIKNCIILNCGDGIRMNINRDTYCVVVITNNTIYNNTNGLYLPNPYPYSTIHIFGNIIAFNKENGIYTDNINKLSINYNDVYANLNDYKGCQKGTGDISKDAKFMDVETGNFILMNDSPCINSGIFGDYFDPDGTRNDMGAYAGPDSASFWPYVTGGPIVTDIVLIPSSVPQGESITVTAKGQVR